MKNKKTPVEDVLVLGTTFVLVIMFLIVILSTMKPTNYDDCYVLRENPLEYLCPGPFGEIPEGSAYYKYAQQPTVGELKAKK